MSPRAPYLVWICVRSVAAELESTWVELPEFELNSTLVERVATESTTVVTPFGLRLLYLVGETH